MLARRVIAISPDKALGKRLTLALKAAGGTVESYESAESLGVGDIAAALLVVHAPTDPATTLSRLAARMPEGGRIIAVLAQSDLAAAVDVMRVGDTLAAVLVADQFHESELSGAATRVLYGDIFGLEKLVPYGVRIHSALVGDYQEKSICIAQVSEFATSMGVRRKYREAIEQCLDEMLMNALYDAPVDSQGKPLFADVPTKTRISLRMEQKAVVQYACSADRFVLSVRDHFGTLERATVLRYLHKCLHSDEQIDRKTGGAGLGLYIMANASSDFLFNVLPGVATECICSFDIRAPKVQLERFGYFTERIDASGRLVAGPSKLAPAVGFPVERREPRPPAPGRAVTWGLGAAIALLVVLIGLVAYPRLRTQPTATLRVHTEPADALVDIDGKTRGSTADGQLLVSDLEAGRAYRVSASREGWEPEELVVEPSPGVTTDVTLRLAPRAATVKIDSDPGGARVSFQGQELGATPLTTTSLPPGGEATITVGKAGYRDEQRTIRVPGSGGTAFVSVELTMAGNVGTVAITSEPAGARVYQNGELLTDKVTPVREHLIEADREYTFTLKAPGHMPARVTARVRSGQRAVPVHTKLRPGGGLTVRANIPGWVTVLGAQQCSQRAPVVDCPLPDGEYKIRFYGSDPFARSDATVVIAGNEVTQDLQFGIVQARPGYKIQRRGELVSKVAFREGNRTVALIAEDTGKVSKVDVRVEADRTIQLPRANP